MESTLFRLWPCLLMALAVACSAEDDAALAPPIPIVGTAGAPAASPDPGPSPGDTLATGRAGRPGLDGRAGAVGTAGAAAGVPAPAAPRLKLPIEVLGVEGTTESARLQLTDDEAEAAGRLWLQVNNLSYENKASVQVNDGPWLPLNHQTVALEAPEEARGGMAHGAFNTIRFSVPAPDLRVGENIVRFRFDHSDGISMGYRVVRLDLLNGDGERLLGDRAYGYEDPARWQPPLAGQAAITEGERLWRDAPLWNHYLPDGREGFWYAKRIASRRKIRATCSDCHTQDGRDLEIFAYSNHSIIERSKFHGLSQKEGELIASYIRSLSRRHDTIGRYGRPWDPPYQPGPAVAERPTHEWAAGAGLDAVLDEDRDMLDAMFPDGVSEAAVDAYFDSATMVDHSTLPLAIQLPDWKHWLPMVHPKDAFENDGFYEDPTVEFNPTRAYETLREFMEARPVEERTGEELLTAIRQHWRHYRLFLAQGSDSPRHWRTRDGAARRRGLSDPSSVPDLEFAATSLARLHAVKHFEIMNEFDLQDEALRIVDPLDQPGERQWIGRDYAVFEIPAHFTASFDDVDSGQYFQGQPEVTGQYETTSWYELQLVLNGGQGMIQGNSPVDNNYHPEFILISSRTSQIEEPLRYYSALNAMYQTRTWTGATTPNDGRGFRIRIQGPWYFLGKEGDARRNHFHGFEPGYYPTLLDGASPGLTRWVLNALMRQLLRELARPANDLSGWDRLPGPDPSNALEALSKSRIVDVTERGPESISNTALWADHMVWALGQAAELGVACELIEGAIAWSQRAWPNIEEFESLRDAPRAFVTLRLDGTAVEALIGNGGDRPTVAWRVNGEPVSEAGSVLRGLRPGDDVEVTVTSDVDGLPRLPGRDACDISGSRRLASAAITVSR